MNTWIAQAIIGRFIHKKTSETILSSPRHQALAASTKDKHRSNVSNMSLPTQPTQKGLAEHCKFKKFHDNSNHREMIFRFLSGIDTLPQNNFYSWGWNQGLRQVIGTTHTPSLRLKQYFPVAVRTIMKDGSFIFVVSIFLDNFSNDLTPSSIRFSPPNFISIKP